MFQRMEAENGQLQVFRSHRHIAMGPMAEGCIDAVNREGLIAFELLEADYVNLLFLQIAGQLLTTEASELVTKTMDIVRGNGQGGGVSYHDGFVVELDDGI